MDVFGTLAGVEPGSALDVLRDRRPQARLHSQASHDALFSPRDAAEMSVIERLAVAAYVSGLHAEPVSAKFHADRLAEAAPDLSEAVAGEAAAGAAPGPFGAFPKGPLSVEDTEGPPYRPSASRAAVLGPRLAAAFGHAHMLVFHPRDARAGALQALLDAGWSTTGIVTLSQLVAFLSYQIRAAHGLRVLAGHPGGQA